jgi:hypothetical protein
VTFALRRPRRPGIRPAMGWRRAARSSVLVGFGRPRLWPFALVAFLLRGGWALFLLPIVVIPSTVAIATAIGPLAVTPAGPSEGLLGLIAIVLALAAAWILVGGLVAAAAEAVLVREALADGLAEGYRLDRPVGPSVSWRLLAARLIAAIPLVVAIGWGIPRAVGATYSQLVLPTDPGVALPVRVLQDLPDVIAIVVAAGLLAEVVGAVAARRVVLFDEGPLEAVAFAGVHLVTHPLPSAATAVLTLAGSVVLVVPALVVAGLAWDRLGTALPGGVPAPAILALTTLFVIVWTTGLLLAAAASSWRSAAWTLEVIRADRRAVPAPALETGPARLSDGDRAASAP